MLCLYVVRLSNQSGNMPMQEPAVDEASRKKMMAYCHRKQQQNEKLMAEEEDTEWANTNALKRAFISTNKQFIYK